MQNKVPINKQQLKTLFETTYQGTSTQSIHQSFNELMHLSLNSYNQFLGQCENILQTQSNNRALCMSIVNFIKVLTKKVVDERLIDQYGPKNFINRIEHIFDNFKISPFLKEDIAFSYLKAALYFRMNCEKIIEKIFYLYNVKDFHMAVYLSRAYIACGSCLDSKAQGLYYKKILPAQLKHLNEEINCYKGQVENNKNFDNLKKMQESSKRIEEILRNIHNALVGISFQKYETSIFQCLQKDELLNILNSIGLFENSKEILILLREVIQSIVENLCRMRRIQKMPRLMELISRIVHEEWTYYQRILLRGTSCISSQIRSLHSEMDAQTELSLINLLTACFNSHLIMIIDDKLDVFTLLIVPLFQMQHYLFAKSTQTIKETLLLIEDCTFFMKSQSLEVAFNRLVKALLHNYQSINSKIAAQVDALLVVNVPHQISQNDQNKILMLLNFITFQASHFLTQDSFISKLQNFIKNNYQLLFLNPHSQFYLQSLILLHHFIDDIFCECLQIDIFQIIAQNFIHHTNIKQNGYNQKHETVLKAEFQKYILNSFFSAGFSEREVKRSSQILINFLTQSFNSECLIVFTNLIKNYPIDDKITLQIMDRLFEKINDVVLNKNINLEAYEELQAFMQFLITFFDLENYKYLFESTLARILPIFQVMIGNKNRFGDQFFTIIRNFTKNLEYVPENYLEWMGNIYNNQMMQSPQGFKSLAIILQNLSPSKHLKDNLKYQLFVNCIALNLVEILVMCSQTSNHIKDENILGKYSGNQKSTSSFFGNQQDDSFQTKQLYALLCLHQLIHFHSQFLTKKIILHIVNFTLSKIIPPNQIQSNRHNINHQEEFSFLRGKYQLIVVLLLKRRLQDVNEILTQTNRGKIVYDTIYMKQSHYLIEYDCPLFIKQQAQILRNLIQYDELQMAYANTSFLAIFHKFTTLYGTKSNQKGRKTLVEIQSDDSDEQDFKTESQFKKKYRETAKIVLDFPLPKEWNHIDGLKQIRQLILELKSHPSSRQWLQILYDKCLNNDQKKVMEELLKNLETVKGKYRHIVKVDRTKPQKQVFPSQKQNTV